MDARHLAAFVITETRRHKLSEDVVLREGWGCEESKCFDGDCAGVAVLLSPEENAQQKRTVIIVEGRAVAVFVANLVIIGVYAPTSERSSSAVFL